MSRYTDAEQAAIIAAEFDGYAPLNHLPDVRGNLDNLGRDIEHKIEVDQVNYHGHSSSRAYCTAACGWRGQAFTVPLSDLTAVAVARDSAKAEGDDHIAGVSV